MEHSKLYDLSKNQVAPILCDYVYWVLKCAEVRGIQTLYFLARDGYVLKQIAEIICKEKKIKIICKYLYCSRASLRMPSYHIIDKAEAYDLLFLGGYHVSLKSILDRAEIPQAERNIILQECGFPLSIDLNQERSYSEIQNYRHNFEKSNHFYQIVIQNSKQAYPETIAYFSQEGLFHQDTIGIVDSGWTGSMQRSLRQLLQSAGYQGKITGFYFGMYQEPKSSEDGEYLCWYFSSGKNRWNKILFCNNLFECFLSAPHGMTLAYQRCGLKSEPVLAPPLSEKETNLVKTQILGILDGTKKCINSLNVSCKKSEAILRKLMAFPDQITSQIYGEFLFCDDITESYQLVLVDRSQMQILKQYILPIRIACKFIRKEKSFTELYWPFGMVAQITNPLLRGWYRFNLILWQWLKYTLGYANKKRKENE